jgi:Mn2+/Fe2+ NRAMP family transporter
LWLATKYLFDRGTFHWIASIPAVIGTSMTVAYIATAGIGLNLPMDYSKPIGVLVAVVGLIGLVLAHNKKVAPAV